MPFVAESPFMSFLMNNPADYRAHMNPESKLAPENRQWHQEHGFPYLNGRGRLVIKDVIMMGAALVCMADSTKRYLHRRTAAA